MRKRKASTPSKGVSRRKSMDEEFKASGREFQAWLNLMPDFVIIVNGKGKILAVNDAVEKLGGFKRQELLGKNFFEENILTAKSKAIAIKNLARRRGGTEVSPYEIELVTESGERRWGEANSAKIVYKKKPAILAVFRDITERKQAEEALRQREERYRTYIEEAGDLIFTLDASGKITFANRAVCETTGYAVEELLEKNPLEFIAPDYRASVETALRRILRGEDVERIEVEIPSKDGRSIFLEVRGRTLRDNGRVVGSLHIARNITERKQMDEALAIKDSAMASSVNAIAMSDLAGNLTYINNSFLKMWGYDNEEEVLGRSVLEFWETKERPMAVIKALRNQGSCIGELPAIRKNGTPFDVHLSATMVKNDSGKQTCMMASFIDITERKRAQQALKQLEAKLRALHKHARTLAAANTVEEVAKHTLDAMEFTLGFDVADFCTVEKEYIHVCESRGMQVSPSEWPLDGPGVVVSSVKTKRALRIADTREEPSFVDRRSFSAKEELQPMLSELAVPVLIEDKAIAVLNVESSRLNAFTGEDQELLETLAMHVASALGRLKQVASLERLVEQRAGELKTSEEKYRLLVNNMTDIVFTIDPKGNFTFCGQGAEKMTGYSVEQLLSMNMKELIAPEYLQEIQERLQARIRGEEYLLPHQFEIIRADGKRLPVEMTTTRIVEKGTLVGIQGIARDIAERRQMEKGLREAERLAAIGETTAMVGHDLRNPLTGIAGAVYVLKTISNMKSDSKAREFLDLIERNVEYSDKIINDLLDYSAELHLNLTTTNPRSITTDALRFIAIPENIQVKDLTRNDTQLVADAEKMRRVVVNLMANAVDAMRKGGTLTISSRQSNGDVEIAFSDTGIGMTKETMEKLWAPLLTTKAKGMGFGLAIVKRIVEAHGGSVFVETSAGRGSTFRVKLPIEPELKGVNKT